MIYTLPSENVADSVTPSLDVGTADAENPLANLTNNDPAIPFFTTDAIGIRVTWDFTSPQRVDYVSMPMHGLPVGTLARFQMNATDSWGSPSVDGALTISAFLGDFPRVQILDVTGATGYLVGGYRFASLFVPSHGGITKIGDFEIWSQKRELEFSLRFGVQHPTMRKTTIHERQDGGRLVFDHQLLRRSIQGTIRTDDTEYTQLENLHADSKGATVPFLVNVAAAREHMLVWWAGAFSPTFSQVNTRDVDVDWVELGRGMPL